MKKANSPEEEIEGPPVLKKYKEKERERERYDLKQKSLTEWILITWWILLQGKEAMICSALGEYHLFPTFLVIEYSMVCLFIHD